jgi:hypothetical protein
VLESKVIPVFGVVIVIVLAPVPFATFTRSEAVLPIVVLIEFDGDPVSVSPGFTTTVSEYVVLAVFESVAVIVS